MPVGRSFDHWQLTYIKPFLKNMNLFPSKKLIVLFLFLLSWNSHAQETVVKYLSGTDSDHTVEWDFYCTDGRKSGEWSTIPVPSNWEQFGFGTYNYGHAKDEERGKEEGLYKHEFDVPGDWKGKQVDIVFEGSMTDTEVKVNGQLAGEVHQGSFYRFSYDISKLLKYGQPNVLEVRVAKHSANQSVNRAERYSDFWIFGGIFRPVYLEAKPKQNIERVAVDAQADGSFMADVFLKNARNVDELIGQVMTLDGEPVGAPFTVQVNRGDEKIHIASQLENIKTWNPESPNLYQVKFGLRSKGRVVHEMGTRFGFRTIDVRDRDGIYVN